MLNPTPPEHLVDAQGRPYFLWDVDMTLAEFRDRLEHGDRAVRAYLLGKLMRQARADDVFQFVELADIRDLWPEASRHLGRSREFWVWILGRWGVLERDDG